MVAVDVAVVVQLLRVEDHLSVGLEAILAPLPYSVGAPQSVELWAPVQQPVVAAVVAVAPVVAVGQLLAVAVLLPWAL